MRLLTSITRGVLFAIALVGVAMIFVGTALTLPFVGQSDRRATRIPVKLVMGSAPEPPTSDRELAIEREREAWLDKYTLN